MNMGTIRILLADDHHLVRAGIRSLLEGLPDIEVVPETGDGRDAIELVRTHVPDLVFHNADSKNSISLMAPGNLQDMVEYARICKEKGIDYICDPGQSLTQWKGETLREWLDGSMLLISNDYEREMIMKMTGMDKKRLLGLTKIIITTLGENGSLISSPAFDVPVPAAKVHDVVDPTGAGDAYRAGLLKGIVSGRDIETSAKMGTVAASFAIERYGTQEHYYTYEDFIERYKNNFGEL